MQKPIVRNNNGRCIIRFKYAGKPYSITQGYYANEIDRTKLDAIASQIYFDLLSGHFDETLIKYKPELAKQLEWQAKEKELSSNPSLESYSRFVEIKRKEMQYSSWTGYRALQNRLEQYCEQFGFPVTAEEFKQFLAQQEVKEKTRKNYYAFITAYGDYLVKHGFSVNPYKGIKIKVQDRPLPEPFTREEIKQIIKEFEHRYCTYSKFVMFKFATGVRTGEAVGLRWTDIDFEQGFIKIYESVTKAELGEKVRKSTKNKKGRTIPMGESLRKLLIEQKNALQEREKTKNSELVFPNGYNKPIDSSHFSEKYWKTVLEVCEIPYREPYTTRHTFISHALAQGMNPLEVAAITGHDVSTLFKHYAGLINKTKLPELV
jgi:integrase